MVRRVFAGALVFSMAACTGEEDEGGPGGGLSHTTTAAGMSTTGASSSSTGGAPPVMELLHEIGRFDRTDPAKPAFSWPGTSIGQRFDGACQSIQVALDGQPTDKFVTGGGQASYPIATNLASGAHDVRITRRNEGFFGDVSFVSFDAVGCAAVESPAPPARGIEFVGDSITCGYGIEGPEGCSFSGDTETVFTTYAAIAARNLGATAHFIAYSGKGIHQNYGGDTEELMPELYLRTLTVVAGSTYDFTQYDPDVVLVNLGTNDFSAAIDANAFVADYVAFLGAIRQRRPDATIVCVKWVGWGASNEALVDQAISAFGDAKVLVTEFEMKSGEGAGCDVHPSLTTNARLGAELTSFLQANLGW